MAFFAFRRSERGLLCLLFSTEFARGAFFFTFLPFWVVNQLGLPVTVTGLAISAHYLTETVFKVIAGWEFDQLGKPIFVGGLTISFLSFLLLKFWPSPAIIVAGAGLFGLGFSPVWPGIMSRLAPAGTPGRSTRISMVFATWLAGVGSGMASVNFILARSYDFVFWFTIGMWACSLAMACIFMEKGDFLVKKHRRHFKHMFKTLKQMSTNKMMINLLLPGMFLQTLAAGLLLPVLPLFVQHHLDLNNTQYGFLLATGGTAAVAALLPMGYLAGRVAHKLLLGTGFGLSSFFLAHLFFSRGITEIFLLAAFLGFSYAIILPAWNSLLAKVIPPDSQATGWSLFATVEGLGITLGPAAGSFVAALIGIPATLFTTTGVLLAASLFYFFFPIKKIIPEN